MVFQQKSWLFFHNGITSEEWTCAKKPNFKDLRWKRKEGRKGTTKDIVGRNHWKAERNSLDSRKPCFGDNECFSQKSTKIKKITLKNQKEVVQGRQESIES